MTETPIAEATEVYAEVVQSRSGIYGEVDVEFHNIAKIWSGIIGIEIRADQVALMMIGLKLNRASITPDYSDNSDDIEGYLGIFRELIGSDMVYARTTEEYQRKKNGLSIS